LIFSALLFSKEGEGRFDRIKNGGIRNTNPKILI
jgi:hypothetical protein